MPVTSASYLPLSTSCLVQTRLRSHAHALTPSAHCFRFAKYTQDLGTDHSICGTPDYIAPEILISQSYGPGVDIWAAGVITFILLGGYPPFFHDDEQELFNIIKAGQFEFQAPWWDHVTEAAKSVIAQMLTVDPAQRPSAEVVTTTTTTALHTTTRSLRLNPLLSCIVL